jgi:hypothetical protein
VSRHQQQMLAELIKRLAAEPDVFNHGATKFRNLLNDFLPGQRIERFWVCCVFEMPSFVSALVQGQVQRADISRVDFFLHQKLGLTESVARWISETWAIAFGIKKPEDRTSFSCPHCGRDGLCDEGWRDRIATCPACNALLRFSSSLDISLEKRGWPTKRLKNREWLLTDPVFALNESALRKAIAQTIYNENLSSSEIAKHLGLDLIVGSLQTEIMTLLGGILNTWVAANENLVKAVLRSALREEYVCFDFDEDFPLPHSFGTAEHSGTDEKWVAVVGSSSKTPFHGLAFSDRSLYYAKDGEYWAVPYVDLHQLPITLGESITQLRLGDHRVVELKGLGIPRRAIQPVLSIIGKSMYEVSSMAWR